MERRPAAQSPCEGRREEEINVSAAELYWGPAMEKRNNGRLVQSQAVAGCCRLFPAFIVAGLRHVNNLQIKAGQDSLLCNHKGSHSFFVCCCSVI